MKEKQHNLLLKIILIFVLLQPFLDILSRAAIKGFIPNISTFVKPLFAFGMAAYLLICYHPKRNKWLLYILVFGLFTLIHLFILLMLGYLFFFSKSKYSFSYLFNDLIFIPLKLSTSSLCNIELSTASSVASTTALKKLLIKSSENLSICSTGSLAS